MIGYKIHDGASATISAVGQLYFGDHNIIPSSWLDKLRTPADRPYLAAALVLSEVVYWYRPLISRNEDTGQVDVHQRFKADKWQMNYDQVAERFGLSKKQIQRALAYLESQGMIERELRTVKGEKGQKLGNVVYISLNVTRLTEISGQVDKFVQSVQVDKFVQSDTSGGRLDKFVQTYTYKHNTDTHLKDPTAEAVAPNASKIAQKGPEAEDKGQEPQGVETPHQQLMRLYQDALGYKIPNGGKEGQAAQKILKADYLPEDAAACYRWLKSDGFWATKHLSLWSVYEQLGPWDKAGRPKKKGQANGKLAPVSKGAMSVAELEAENAKAAAQLAKMRGTT